MKHLTKNPFKIEFVTYFGSKKKPKIVQILQAHLNNYYFNFFFLFFLSLTPNFAQNTNIIINSSSDYFVNSTTLGRTVVGGDTIFIDKSRTKALRFINIEGNETNPVVIINKGGQVNINDPETWGAITFENCKYIKISGAGHPNYKYGFLLSAVQSGLAFTELSSNCEAEFIKISHFGFFGIFAKKDYNGNPPIPIPVFDQLIVHDCFIENVEEGMYLGETKSPGMEFKHVKIYNNIIRNTFRESIQIANMVEDVQIYRNTMINAGLGNIIYHTNNLQIGANSVANVYNNIISGAPSFGIINLGKGNCNITNNFIASNLGIFLDNRILSEIGAPVNIKQNYFRDIVGNSIIRNMNEDNYITIENNKYNTNIPFFLNQSGNSNNYYLNNNNLIAIEPLNFTDAAINDYSHSIQNPVEYADIGATGGPEYFQIIVEVPEPISSQIVVTPNMVSDLVAGGSVFSPNYLFDEQNLNPKTNTHPISLSWKPYYNTNNAPYYTTIDLGKEYNLTEIYLHDMHSTYQFVIQYGNGTNTWTTLLDEPCNNFNVWKKHTTNVSTRYLRLFMPQSPYAAVNEIILYGYEVIPITAARTIQTLENSSSSPILNEEQDAVKLYPNPVDNELHLEFSEKMFGINNIKIIDSYGKVVFNKKVNISTPIFSITLDEIKGFLPHDNYCNFVFCKNENGKFKALKFYLK